MASIDIESGWIYPLSDPSSGIAVPVGSVSSSETSLTEVRQFAGGVRRAIIRPGSKPSFRIRLGNPSREAAEALKLWLGEPVVYRDRLKRVIFGLLSAINTKDTAIVGEEIMDEISLTLLPTSETADIG